MEVRNFCRGHHLYSAGRPSHWASAHILVLSHISLDICWKLHCWWYAALAVQCTTITLDVIGRLPGEPGQPVPPWSSSSTWSRSEPLVEKWHRFVQAEFPCCHPTRAPKETLTMHYWVVLTLLCSWWCDFLPFILALSLRTAVSVETCCLMWRMPDYSVVWENRAAERQKGATVLVPLKFARCRPDFHNSFAVSIGSKFLTKLLLNILNMSLHSIT